MDVVNREELPDCVHLEHSGFRVSPQPRTRDYVVWILVLLMGLGPLPLLTMSCDGFMLLPWVGMFLGIAVPYYTRRVIERCEVRVNPAGIVFEKRMGPWRRSFFLEPHDVEIRQEISGGGETDVNSRIDLICSDGTTYSLHFPQTPGGSEQAVRGEIETIVSMIGATLTSDPGPDDEATRLQMKRALRARRHQDS